MNKVLGFKLLLLLTLLSLSLPASVLAAVPYVVTDIGRLDNPLSPGGGTVPGFPGNSINNAGEIVGASESLPFLYSGGQIINLETFSDTPLPPVPRSGYAHGINDAGHVVGVRNVGEDPEFGATIISAFMYDGHTMHDLGTLNENEFSVAHAINNNDQVVGYSGMNAFLYSNGTMTDVGKLPGHNNAVAQDINDNGTVVGYGFGSYPATSTYLPVTGFVYNGGSISPLNPLSGDTASIAYSINEAGQIVGSSWTDPGMGQNGLGFSAVIWDNGTVIDLGTLDGHTESSAHGINNHGDIVGESWHGDDGRPFLYSGGQMYDLLSLIQPGPYNIINAYGINDLGQILAYGGNAAGEARVFLLTPVPEPETYALMLSGLLMLLIRSKRKLQQSQWVHRLLQMAGRSYAIHSFA